MRRLPGDRRHRVPTILLIIATFNHLHGPAVEGLPARPSTPDLRCTGVSGVPPTALEHSSVVFIVSAGPVLHVTGELPSTCLSVLPRALSC